MQDDAKETEDMVAELHRLADKVQGNLLRLNRLHDALGTGKRVAFRAYDIVDGLHWIPVTEKEAAEFRRYRAGVVKVAGGKLPKDGGNGSRNMLHGSAGGRRLS